MYSLNMSTNVERRERVRGRQNENAGHEKQISAAATDEHQS